MNLSYPEGQPMPRRIFNGTRDLTSGTLHLIGMLLSIAGVIVLIARAVLRNAAPRSIASYFLYGASLILLYAASSLYHFFYISDRVRLVLRKIDHIMIFVLIAGTYTPICLVTLQGRVGWTLFGVVWGMAVAGTCMKLFWMDAPRWLYTAYYILMGWAAIVPIVPIWRNMELGGVLWLLAGGLFYTVGGVCYALKKPNINFPGFGFHELFHVFILLGSISHYFMMLLYVV